jgi:hypothetical protein
MGDFMAMTRLAAKPGGVVRYYGNDAQLEIAGRRIFAVHYPHIAEGMAATGAWDLVCCGHSHRAGIAHVRNVRGGATLLVNPGTVAGLSAPLRAGRSRHARICHRAAAAALTAAAAPSLRSVGHGIEQKQRGPDSGRHAEALDL